MAKATVPNFMNSSEYPKGHALGKENMNKETAGNVSEAQILNNLLSNVETPLADLWNLFLKQFSGDYFRPCFIIASLLQNNILSKMQRPAAFYLIMRAFPSDGQQVLSGTPFAYLFYYIFENSKDDFEKHILNDILTNKGKKFEKFSLLEIVQESNKFSEPDKILIDFNESLKKIYQTSAKKNNCLNDFLAPLVATQIIGEDLGDAAYIPTFNVRSQDYATNNMTPEFLRLVPPEIELMDDEINWLIPGVLHEFTFPEPEINELHMKSNLKDLLSKEKLSSQEKETLTQLIEDINYTTLESLVDISMIKRLINVEPIPAAKLIIRFSSNKSTTFPEILSALNDMEFSLHVLEVVHKLTGDIILPAPFLNLFIMNIMKHCENLQKEDEKTEKADKSDRQKRTARLIAVFLKSLFQKKLHSPDEITDGLLRFTALYNQINEVKELQDTVHKYLENKKNNSNQQQQQQQQQQKLN